VLALENPLPPLPRIEQRLPVFHEPLALAGRRAPRGLQLLLRALEPLLQLSLPAARVQRPPQALLRRVRAFVVVVAALARPRLEQLVLEGLDVVVRGGKLLAQRRAAPLRLA
jgi:hypothetical protein